MTAEVPISRTPLLSRLMGVPEMVTPLPPAVIVCPSMENAEGLAVKTWPPTVKTDDAVAAAKFEGTATILDPTTKPPAPRETI